MKGQKACAENFCNKFVLLALVGGLMNVDFDSKGRNVEKLLTKNS